jgi:hypothetical protein
LFQNSETTEEAREVLQALTKQVKLALSGITRTLTTISKSSAYAFVVSA